MTPRPSQPNIKVGILNEKINNIIDKMKKINKAKNFSFCGSLIMYPKEYKLIKIEITITIYKKKKEYKSILDEIIQELNLESIKICHSIYKELYKKNI